MRHLCVRLGVVFLTLVFIQGIGEAAQPDFTASYELLLDGTGFYSGDDLSVGRAVMSADASTILAYTFYYYGDERNLFLINPDTGGRVDVALDATASWGVVAPSMAISQNGSVAFIADTARDSIFRVSGGTMTKIFDKSDWSEINYVNELRTTASGDVVYFREDLDDIWMVAAGGGAPTRVVNDSEVPRDGGTGRKVRGFDVSDDGGTIVFSLYAYYNGSATITNPEVFVKDSSGYRQLTDDAETSEKIHLEVSGDGSTAVICDIVSNWWTALDVATGSETLLYPRDINSAGAVMPLDGSRVFISDDGTHRGHLIRSNGTDGIDLFPSAPIYIGATYSPQISANGSRVAFVHSTRLLYTGELWPASALHPGPTVHSINFDPPYLPDNDPSATVVLTSAISDPDGLVNVARTSVDHLLDGIREPAYEDLPVFFTWNPHDDGSTPDAVPGDGIYSTLGETAPAYPDTSELTIRVSAQDDEGHVYVRDVNLFICPSEGCAQIFADGFEGGNTSAWNSVAP